MIWNNELKKNRTDIRLILEINRDWNKIIVTIMALFFFKLFNSPVPKKRQNSVNFIISFSVNCYIKNSIIFILG